MKRRINKKKLNKSISRQYKAIFAATVVMIVSILCILLLFFTPFYSVYVNGHLDVVRKVIRYSMYSFCIVGVLLSAVQIELAIEKLQEYTSIKKYIRSLDRR